MLWLGGWVAIPLIAAFFAVACVLAWSVVAAQDWVTIVCALIRQYWKVKP